MYAPMEVRIPSWTQDEEAVITSVAVDFDQAMCEGSDARPYNSNRIKSATARFTFEEVEELQTHGLQNRIKERIIASFQLLKSSITAKFTAAPKSNCAEFELTQLAVAGIDMMVDKEYNPYIVELNNNPAMAPCNREMSPAYRAHLIEFIQRLVLFAEQNEGETSQHFIKIW